VEALDVAKARELTDEIRSTVANLERLPELVCAAYEGRAWKALDFDSWDAYCRFELDTDRVKIPRGDRGEIATQLRGRGLSVRAIASATGASVGTIAADLAGVQNRTPAPAGDGEQDVVAGLLAGLASVTDKVPGNVVGIDGKRYPAVAPPPARPTPVPQRRGPLVDSYTKAVWDLDRAVRRLERLHTDDRFRRHRRDLGASHGGMLTSAVNLLTELRDDIEIIDTKAVES
jgi:hypothetical protein